MKSSIRIDFVDRGTGRGMEPLIRAELKNSDDPRDKLLASLFQSIRGSLQVSYSNPKWITGSGGEPDAESTAFLFRPEQVQEAGSYIIRDNSIGLRNFLKDQGIGYKGHEHSTIVYLQDAADLFSLGQKLDAYKREHPNG